MISSFDPNDQTDNDDNYCLRIDNPETQDAAINGDLQLNSVIVACQEPSKGNAIGGFASEQLWAESVGNQFATLTDGVATDATAAADADLQLLETSGETPPIYSIAWTTSFVDGQAPVATTAPTAGNILGALEASADWTSGWTFGLFDGVDANGNPTRGQPLWFE